MSAFKTELQALIARHVAAAPAPQMLRLVETLATETEPEPVATATDARARFVKLDAEGHETEGYHVAVYNRRADLVWTAEPLGGGADLGHADAMKACAGLTLLGSKGWRAPTIQELLAIVDYTRCDPAVDTDYFKGPYGWTWSATLAASPSGYAWFVGLADGYSSRGLQGYRTRVLAVRAGQSLGLRF